MPSVSASWVTDCLLPQAPSVSAAAVAARSVRDFVEVRRIRGAILPGGDRGPMAASAVFLEDRTQAAHGAPVLAAQPAAGTQRLAELVGEQLRLALEGERHTRAAARAFLELVRPERADAVVLAGAAGLDDEPR